MSAKEELTARQREVLGLLAKGHTNGEIAEMLGISADGVKWHVGEILARLGVHSREEAAEWWRRDGKASARIRQWIGGTRLWPLAAGVGIAGVASIAVVLVVVALRSGGGPPETMATAVHSVTPTAEPTTAPSPTATTAALLPDGPLPFRICAEIDGYRKLTTMEMTEVFHTPRFGDGVRPDPFHWSLFLSDFYWTADPHAISANIDNNAFGKGTSTATTAPRPDTCGIGDRQDEGFQAIWMYDHRVVGKSASAYVNGLQIVDVNGQVLIAKGLGAADWEFRDDGSFLSGFVGAGAPYPQTLELTRAADIELFCTRPASAVTFRSVTGETKVVRHHQCDDVWTPVAEVHLEPGVWSVSVDGSEAFYTLLAKDSPRPCRC